MAIAITLKEYFENEDVHYDTIKHRRAKTLLDSSRSAHLPAGKVAKAVVLQSEDGDYLMASLPANSRVSLTEVNDFTGKQYHLVSEEKLLELFPDCSQGAVPAMGTPYNMSMLIDESLLASDSVYIESGDHESLLKLSHQEYSSLIENMAHSSIQGANIGSPRIWSRTGRNWQI
ncbi:YbaK/EbsC family protein [Psychromonas aquimarina]|uniref:YbaK/EbsC family protein n=1 Tax=Psychromonas aquimarina TaxID=444919 RepID=UPI00042558C4|nr:YbaK/EbsC family protein [Psychromonas aquimarina]